jgi:hypothetical protein
LSIGVKLAAITDAHTFSTKKDRAQSARSMRDQLGPSSANGTLELLCDGLGSGTRTNAAEAGAWRDWTGARLSPKRILGEGLMAAAAWQCVAACDTVANGRFAMANVSLIGFNQQAIGAKFEAVKP